MAIVTVGKGTYTTTLPQGEIGVTNWQGVNITPLVTNDFVGAIPTNDWASSIVFPQFGNPYSAPLFAQPLNMQADQNGLNLGYTATPTYIKDGSGNIVKYEFTYHDDLLVSLQGMQSGATLLQSASDWMVNTVWQDSDSANKLEATFGHGSPFVYFTREGNADVSISLEAHTANTIGQPNQINEVFQLSHVNGTLNSNTLAFNLVMNTANGEGSAAGNAAEARISIDSDGNGTFDYVKTFNFIPLDADTVNNENYNQTEGRGVGAETSGQLQNLNNATVKVEVWKAFGTGDIQLQTGAQSYIDLPFSNLSDASGSLTSKLYLTDNSTLSATVPATEAITLGSSTASQAAVAWDGPGQIWYANHNVLGITINGNNYGLFAPVGSDWHVDNGVITSNLAGKDYFSAALLPDNTVTTLNYFYEHAYAFITDSQANYSYDPNTSSVTTNFTLQTDLKEAGFSDQALTALYSPQWSNTNDTLTDYSYETPRGEMKLFDGNSFSTELPFTGVLPALPNMLDANQTQQLYNLIDAEYQKLAQSPIAIPGQDTYWVGKEMARLSELTQLANQVGHEPAKELFLNTIRNELQDWFTASSDEGDKQFYYNSEWNTLQGYPASFNSNQELNDHHFHYGYFVKAAATVAQFDPTWVNDWGGMVNLLIKDVANNDRTDTNYPYFRSFDPYQGNSWASGHGAFFSGNNQESSSESMNLASALVSWGAQTNNANLQSLGAYLYSTELAAIQNYWFDTSNTTFPDGFNHNVVGMIWGDGGAYATWFSGDPEMIQGINYLPITAGSLYLGLDPAYVQQNYEALVAANGGPENQWVDIIWQYQAFFDPQAAVNKFNANPNYQPEEGESRAHTYDWLNNFNALGEIDGDITANTPFFTVFNKDGLLTYSTYNPTDHPIVVTFSDGKTINVASEEFIATNDLKTWSSVTGLVENPNPPPQDTEDEDEEDDTNNNPPVDPDPVVPPPDDTPPPVVVTPPDAQMGTSSADTLIGTTQNDILLGLAGNDTLHGNAGNDTLKGGDGNDTLHGNDGNDQLLGENGNDSLFGNTGDDVLTGGAGADFLVGGDGHDTYVYTGLSDSTNANSDFIETFEKGSDKIDVSALDVNFNQLVFSQLAGYTHVGIQGTDFDIRIGNATDFNSNDFILGAGTTNPPSDPTPDPVVSDNTPPPPPPPPVEVQSPDTQTGTASDDTLIGTTQNDTLNGLAGNDTLHGNSGNDILKGGDGNDTLHGNEGNDQLLGESGNDALFGNTGDDVLTGSAGADFLVGGDGNDIYRYTSLSDSTNSTSDFIETFAKNSDKIDLSALNVSYNQLEFSQAAGYAHIGIQGTDFDVRIGNGVQFDSQDFLLSAANSTPPVSDPIPTPPVAPVPGTPAIVGTNGDDFLSGTPGNDQIQGMDGNDQMHGTAGNDSLFGGNGNDHIYGNVGDDRLEGGAGSDFLVGGDGNDVYSYSKLSDSTMSQHDVIEGFQSGHDQLDFTALHVQAGDVNIQTANGITSVSVNNTSFSVDLIASDQISHDDILV